MNIKIFASKFAYAQSGLFPSPSASVAHRSCRSLHSVLLIHMSSLSCDHHHSLCMPTVGIMEVVCRMSKPWGVIFRILARSEAHTIKYDGCVSFCSWSTHSNNSNAEYMRNDSCVDFDSLCLHKKVTHPYDAIL